MPFTPAHAAIVLPFLKIKQRFLSATALVIGSMAPDFEYFFRFNVEGKHGHELWGLLYFDVPVVLFLSLCFHQVVKIAFINNLPAFFQSRLQHLKNFDFIAYLKNYWFTFLISAWLGALSHVFWDSFTHSAGFFVKVLPIYKDTYVPYDGVRYPLWYALQHMSTVIGLSFIGVYLYFIKPDIQLTYKPSWQYWFAITIITLLVFSIRFAVKSSDLHLGNSVVSLISGFCIALLLCGLIPWKKKLQTGK